MNPIGPSRRRCADIDIFAGNDQSISQKQPLSSGDSFKKNGIAIHFIWMGGNLPPKYLSHIKECAAKALSDRDRGYKFSVNLWVDNVNNYWNTAIKEDNTIHSKRFKLRHLSELNSVITENYVPKTALKIQCYTRRELSGLKNFAAASDILRYITLLAEEGFYFDTDLSFSVAVDEHDQFRDPAKGIDNRKSYWEKEKLWLKQVRCESTLFNVDFPFNNLSMGGVSAYDGPNNCIILARDANDHLNKVVEKVIKNYTEIDTHLNNKGELFKLKSVKSKDEDSIHTNLQMNDPSKCIKIDNYSAKTGTLKVKSKKFKKEFEWTITAMDTKRSCNLSLGRRGGREKLTVDVSLEPLSTKVYRLNMKNGFITKEGLIIYGGPCRSQPIVVKCDGSWMANLKNRSVDEHDIGRNPFKKPAFEINPVIKFKPKRTYDVAII